VENRGKAKTCSFQAQRSEDFQAAFNVICISAVRKKTTEFRAGVSNCFVFFSEKSISGTLSGTEQQDERDKQTKHPAKPLKRVTRDGVNNTDVLAFAFAGASPK